MQYLTVAVRVPASAIDWSECGDGCGEIHGLQFAKVVIQGRRHRVMDFADRNLAGQLMLESLGEAPCLPRRPGKIERMRAYVARQDEKKRALNHYTTLARQAQEMADEMKRRAQA
ncbi:MAG: hypothetical protein CME38_01445 [Haliea sp.]|nr:hypothetical protein [Haliea sp.]|tara:strand:- start:2606 stop:2950 length:345 start_codon:yes stop_codon:yes gene_type:complete